MNTRTGQEVLEHVVQVRRKKLSTEGRLANPTVQREQQASRILFRPSILLLPVILFIPIIPIILFLPGILLLPP